MTPEAFAAIERIVIVLVAAFFAFLGYRLYINGFKSGAAKLQAKSAFGEFVVSGTGPGLLFMGFGGAILFYALATSGVRKIVTESAPPKTSLGAASIPHSSSPASSTVTITDFASSAPAMEANR